MALNDFLITQVLPTLTGAAGGAILRVVRGASRRIAALESQLKSINNTLLHFRERIEEHGLRMRTHESEVDSIQSKLDELGVQIEQIENRMKNLSELRKFIQSFATRSATLEQRAESLETGFNRLDDALSTFIKEQGELWQNMNRTIGQFEGVIDRVSTRRASKNS